MPNDIFSAACQQNKSTLDAIRNMAHSIHAAVNQHYDKDKPYSVHLDAVAEFAAIYAPLIVTDPADAVPLMFGAYFHDSIEDARLTYNNVHHLAQKFMDERQALLATEIVYALTNEKGRNRAERANDKYYAGIRSTPYAPLCKMADRLANVSYSCRHNSPANSAMRHVYAKENKHFVSAITSADSTADPRLSVPAAMTARLQELLS